MREGAAHADAGIRRDRLGEVGVGVVVASEGGGEQSEVVGERAEPAALADDDRGVVRRQQVVELLGGGRVAESGAGAAQTGQGAGPQVVTPAATEARSPYAGHES